MAQSRGCLESGLERRAGIEDGPEYVHAPSCEGNDGLVVTFTLASLAFVEGSAVGMVERAEGGLVEDAFEPLVAAVGSAQEPGSADCRSTGAIPAAAASASAERKRD